MLVEIRDYLAEKASVSINELALHFDVPPDAMRGMLSHWIRKGYVRHTTACSGGCNSCDTSETELYFWHPKQKNKAESAVCLIRG
ncbi:FeoC-like transcriptional regulator [Endozoicomonadaceae bacterium StTr2]